MQSFTDEDYYENLHTRLNKAERKRMEKALIETYNVPERIVKALYDKDLYFSYNWHVINRE